MRSLLQINEIIQYGLNEGSTYLESLPPLLDDSNYGIRSLAAIALLNARMFTPLSNIESQKFDEILARPRMIGILAEATRSENINLRACSLQAIGFLRSFTGIDKTEVLLLVIAALYDSVQVVRVAAATTVGSFESEAITTVPKLMSKISDTT